MERLKSRASTVASEHRQRRQTGPGSGFAEKERPLSGQRVSSSSRWSGEGPLGLHRSCDGELQTAESSCNGLKSGSADGTTGLTPIVQRTAVSPAAGSSFSRQRLSSTGEFGGSSPASGTEHSFRRRLSSNSTPGSTHRAQSRVAQLALAPEQTESPKGLDRALTPSMLKAIKKADVKAEPLAARPPGGLSVFQSSFSRQRSSRDMEAEYENLTASFTNGLQRLPQTDASRAGCSDAKADALDLPVPSASAGASPADEESSVTASAVADGEVRASGGRQLNSSSQQLQHGQLLGMQELQSSPAQDEIQPLPACQDTSNSAGQGPAFQLVADSTGSAPAAQVILDDHVQRLVSSKSLSVSTSKQPEQEEEPSQSHFEGQRNVSGGATLQQKPLKLVRCNITRQRKQVLPGWPQKSIRFSLENLKGKARLVAERESGRQLSYSIFAAADGQEKRTLEASVVSNALDKQFLLIGTDPATPAAACDPDQDPVLMAVEFGKSATGQRTVTVLLPDKMVTSAGSHDLGSRQHISAYFKRIRCGEAVKNVKVLQSMEGRQLLNAGSRIQEPSVKNVQLQLAGNLGQWPDFEGRSPTGMEDKTAKAMTHIVFEFGRRNHRDLFVCDFESPTLTAVQALGLAVACSAPKAAFLYL